MQRSPNSKPAFGILGTSAACTGVMAQESAAVLEEIVVTAQRREERVQDIPIGLTAFSQERMDAQGVLKQAFDLFTVDSARHMGNANRTGSI